VGGVKGNSSSGGKTMRKCMLMGMMCILLFALCGHSMSQETGGPKMAITERVFDFKEVRKGAVVSHSFTVFNHGDETLRILRVRPG